MNGIRLVSLALIVCGAIALAIGSFSYTRDKTALKVGPVQIDVKEKQTVNIPVWAGIAGIVVGGLLMVGTAKRS